MSSDVEVLQEESSYLVISKPAGVFTQAAPGIDSIETRLKSMLEQRTGAPSKPFVGLPHRLDRGTSGVLLIARNERALRRFGDQFQSRKIDKSYLALVDGVVPTISGEWIDHLRKIPDQALAEIVPSDHPEGREAILRFERLWCDLNRSLLRIQLITGRMHQIRVQAASRGFPVVGDWNYGNQSSWGENSDENRRQQFALHARMIEFRHPQTAKKTRVIAPLPSLWSDYLPDMNGLKLDSD